MKERNKRILKWIHIYVFGKHLHLTMFMMKTQLRNSFMRTQPNKQSFLSWRDTMQLFWLMDRQEQERLIPWRDSSTMLVILKEVLFLEVWKRSSDSYRCNQVIILHSWWGHHTCKYIMKSYLICWRLIEPVYKSEKIKRRGFS